MDNSLRGDLPDKVFVNGFRFSELNERTPTFIIAKIGIKVDEFAAFMQQHQKNNGYVNIDIKVGKNGKQYAELNTYVPQKPPAFLDKKGNDVDTSHVPF